MSLIAAHGLGKEFADRTLFSGVTFSVEKGDKIGFIGANGAGKTTLFKLLTDREAPTAGQVIKSSGLSVGYLEQFVCDSSETTAYHEVLGVFGRLIELENELETLNVTLLSESRDAWIERQARLTEIFQQSGGLTYKKRTAAVLSGLGFTEQEQALPVSALSGGQRSKLGLAKLLLCENDLLLLDEPTNHLDISSIGWLEEFLLGFSGAAIIISHDRYFLDRVTNKTMELENEKLFMTGGNYTVFSRLKAEKMLTMQREYQNKMREIERIEGIIEQQRRWNREKNIKTAESKQKQIDRIEKTLEKPETENHTMHFDFPVRGQSGNLVVECENDSCVFETATLYSAVHFKIMRGERVCLLGDNGVGKTTLVRRMLDSKNAANFRFGTGVVTGYYDQFQSDLNPELNPFEEIRNKYPTMTDTTVRSALAAFGFKGEDVFKKNDTLSGGERARVTICRLMLSGANFLVLDEPTNHLDIYSRAALEAALVAYTGTLLVISHDRYFINSIASRVFYLKQSGITAVQGNYDDYLNYLELHTAESVQSVVAAQTEPKKGKESYLNQKKYRSDIRKLETAVARCEDEIAQLECKIEEIHNDISANGSDYARLSELTALLEQQEGALESKMAEWEDITNRLNALSE